MCPRHILVQESFGVWGCTFTNIQWLLYYYKSCSTMMTVLFVTLFYIFVTIFYPVQHNESAFGWDTVLYKFPLIFMTSGLWLCYMTTPVSRTTQGQNQLKGKKQSTINLSICLSVFSVFFVTLFPVVVFNDVHCLYGKYTPSQRKVNLIKSYADI